MAPLVFLLLCGQILLRTTTDTINSTTPLSGSQKIVSQGSKFTLGFYSPPLNNTTSGNYYIAIWYSDMAPVTTVWTATTNLPVSDPTAASLEIAGNGKLILLDRAKNRLLWSTNVSIASNSTMAVLRDSGSLELTDASDSSILYWQSIEHPTNTLLPGSKLRLNKTTGVSQKLVPWRNSADPSPGLFSLELDPNGTAQFFIRWNESVNYWSSDPWNGKYFSTLSEYWSDHHMYNFQFVNDATKSYLYYSVKDDTVVSRVIVDVGGQFKLLEWVDDLQHWSLILVLPGMQCDVYALCGAYSTCSDNVLPYCKCVKGFSPKVQSDWDLQDYSGGCKRNTPLQCQTNSTEFDKFYVMEDVLLPDKAEGISDPSSPQECEVACLSSCSCTAYVYNYTECFIWLGDLVHLREKYWKDRAGTFLLRLAASELPDQQRRKTKIIGPVAGGVAAVLVILAIMLFFLSLACLRVGTFRISKTAGGTPTDFGYNDLLGDIQSIDSLLLDLSTLKVATNDFGERNMLGKGGFGMVHKGVLPDGTQIAVKRLCKSSRQGIAELKSELVLVAKLRHRNLVSLIGVCLEAQEKILVYEFMPNRSLDTILFDFEKLKDLDWGRRFKIISGVSKGLQYLHEDSQLKIVHRDLKPSNVLLDFDYNPKISDFGLAKIFGGDQAEDVTSHIAGTFGYMSPQYAMHGQYSTKSDAFSFGVLVLEIITGRRNNGSCNSEKYVYLVNLVWEHWTRGNIIELIDPSLTDHPSHVDQVLKCIQIGLLCVQNRPEDRPTMSSVSAMLTSHNARLPSVSVPAFCDGLNAYCETPKAASSNGITITKLVPR